MEFRVGDATASPYLALAMLVQAGLDGVRQQWNIAGQTPRPLPTGLAQALDLLSGTPSALEWLGPDLFAAYLKFKRVEMARLETLDETEICRRYAEVC